MSILVRLLLGAVAAVTLGAAPQTAPIEFDWALGAWPSGGTLVDLHSDKTLRDGDRIRALVIPRTRCYVYVLWDDGDAMEALFPATFEQFDVRYEPGDAYYAPYGGWKTLAGHGLAKVRVIASRERLTQFEHLVAAIPEGPRGPRVAAVLAEIKRLEQQHTFAVRGTRPIEKGGIAALPAERPAEIGGTIRGHGEEPDLKTIAYRVDADGFYSTFVTITR